MWKSICSKTCVKVKSILVSLAREVHANETGCVKYLVLEQTSADSDRPDMVLIEEYADSLCSLTREKSADGSHFFCLGRWRSQADLDKHHEQQYLKDTHSKLEKEDLLVEPELIKVVEQVYGFEGR